MEPSGDGLKVAYQVGRQTLNPTLLLHHSIRLNHYEVSVSFRVAPEPTASRPPRRPTRAVTPCPVNTSRPPSRYPVAHSLPHVKVAKCFKGCADDTRIQIDIDRIFFLF